MRSKAFQTALELIKADLISEEAKEAVRKIEQISKELFPNRGAKFEVDLSAARDNASLVHEQDLPHAEFLYLTALRVGNGSFTLMTRLPDGYVLSYTEAELQDGYRMERRMVDVIFTNSAQVGKTNPKLLLEWIE